MVIFPNAVGQTATFDSSTTPDTVNCSAGTALAGCAKFSVAATAGAVADGDVLGVRFELDQDNYKVWAAVWNTTTSKLELLSEELSVGTIPTGSTVNVWATPTAYSMRQAVNQPERAAWEISSATTLMLDASNSGKNIGLTASTDVTVTVSDASPAGAQWMVWQLGAGVVSIGRQSTLTINGGSTPVDTDKRYTAKAVAVYYDGSVNRILVNAS